MREQRTQWEQDQINQQAWEAIASSHRWEEQAVYRMCPVGQWVDEAHFVRDLAKRDGTPRSIAAAEVALAWATRGMSINLGAAAEAAKRDPKQLEAHLGPVPIWAPGRERLAFLEAKRQAIFRRPAQNPPPTGQDGPRLIANGRADGVRTVEGEGERLNFAGRPRAWSDDADRQARELSQ